MVSFGVTFFGIVLMGIGGTGIPSDLVSYIEPENYFRARQVQVTVEKMLELAGKQPTDAKGRVAQLLAIRMLGEQPDEVKKEKETIVKVLEPLATGKQGQDGHGFARAYARRSLRRLGVKVAASERASEELKLIDGFQWFPDTVKLVGGGIRGPEPGTADQKDNPLRAFLKQNLPPQAMEEVYKFVEEVGNVRIDRFAFGYASDPQQPAKSRFFVRISGAADHKALLAFLRKNLPVGENVKEDRGPAGEPISMITMSGPGPGIALVGNTDFLVAGSEDRQANKLELIEQMLKIRASGQSNVFKGPLADPLKKIGARSIFVVLGEVPGALRQGLANGPFPALPERIRVEALPAAKGGLDIQFHGKFDNANAAKGFADSVMTLRKKGLEALKTPPPLPKEIKLPANTFDLMRTALEGLKMEANGDAATGSVQVSPDLVTLMPILFYLPIRSSELPMPQPKAIPLPAKGNGAK